MEKVDEMFGYTPPLFGYVRRSKAETIGLKQRRRKNHHVLSVALFEKGVRGGSEGRKEGRKGGVASSSSSSSRNRFHGYFARLQTYAARNEPGLRARLLTWRWGCRLIAGLLGVVIVCWRNAICYMYGEGHARFLHGVSSYHCPL
ncbi:hypothetical protein L249_8906, partial [Ophiocordyceps polyrhachis-furcata BCC 54312]